MTKNSENKFPVKEWWDVEYHPKDIPRKEYKQGDVVAIFDADTVVFPVSSACQEKTVVVTNAKGQQKEFKNKTKFKGWCKEKGKDFEDYTISEKVVAEPVEYCLGTLKRAIKNLKEAVGATHVELYLGGSGNFRLELPTPIKYKDNRKDMSKPVHLEACQEYLMKYMDAIKVKGLECDDFVNIRTIEVNKMKSVKGVLVTTDKDALATFSDEIYVYKANTLYHLTEPLGELWLDNGGKVKGKGLKWQTTQALITGDATDNYLPRLHFNKTYGEKSWYKDVKDIDNIQEFLRFATEKFRSLVGDVVVFKDWSGKEQKMGYLELADLYFSAAYMKTSNDDQRTFQSLLKEYDVEY